MMASSEQRTSFFLKIVFRILLNTGIVYFFDQFLPGFFVLDGGIRALVFVGIILAILNWLVVPILHIISLPIKLFAWVIAFFLVNTGALWLTVFLVTELDIAGVSLAINGGIIGWLVLSFVLGFCNWLIRAILK